MKLDLAKTNGSSPPSTTTRTTVGNGIAIVAPALTTATYPTRRDIATTALEEPAIKELFVCVDAHPRLHGEGARTVASHRQRKEDL